MMIRSRLVAVVLVVLAPFAVGCSLKGMHEVPADRVSLTPPADQAMVVFLRAAANASTASLFELRGSEQRFIGLLVDGTRMTYATAPGRTRFMVIGRSASFLDADLAAGKTYRVAVLIGVDPDEFIRLAPMHAGAPVSRSVQDCIDACKWVVKGDRADAWAREHAGSIQTKKAQYLPKWESRPNRPMLTASDGS